MLGRRGTQNGRSGKVGKTRTITILGLLMILSLSLLFGGLPQTHYASANSGEVQHTGDYTFCSRDVACSEVVAFGSNVSSGNVVVVAILDSSYGFSTSDVTVHDTLGSSYALAVYMSTTKSGSDQTLLIYTTTLLAAGADSVSVTDSSSDESALFVFIFEVSGVTTAAKETATGIVSCPYEACDTVLTTSSSVSFFPGAFLLAIGVATAAPTPGSGFTFYSFYTPSIFVEYSSSVSSPSNFPVTLTGLIWDALEVGIALQPKLPIATSTVTSLSTITTTESTTITSVPPPVTTTVTSVSTSVSTTTETTTSTPPPVTTTTTLPRETTTVTSTSVSTSTETSVSTQTVTSPTTTTETLTSTSTLTLPPETTTVTSTSTSISTSTQTVGGASITLNCAPASVTLGKNVRCNAVATAGYPPLGNITFTNTQGSGTFGTQACTIRANTLTCTVAYTPTVAGTQKVNATYSGDPNFLAVSTSETINVKPAASGLLGFLTQATTGNLGPLSQNTFAGISATVFIAGISVLVAAQKLRFGSYRRKEARHSQ